METDLAKTFLEVVSAGSFIRASERLHLTQTAVTARIQSLETALDCTLFIRNRSGARLTQEGERFVAHAARIVNAWKQAQNDMCMPEGRNSRLRLGGETSLWNPLLVNWVTWIQATFMDVALETRVSDAPGLICALEGGQLDGVIVHRPNYHSGFVVEQLLEEKLIQVQRPQKREPDLFINWGETFVEQYDAVMPRPRQAAFQFDLGPLALQFMLKNGGNGWFRTRVVAPYLATGELERVKGAPEFTYPVFITYRADADSPLLESTIKGLRSLVDEDPPWAL